MLSVRDLPVGQKQAYVFNMESAFSYNLGDASWPTAGYVFCPAKPGSSGT